MAKGRRELKYYNVHIVDQNKLERLLNDHAQKGYEIRWFRNCGGTAIQVVFEMDAQEAGARKTTKTPESVTA